jgi:hypothetical protein
MGGLSFEVAPSTAIATMPAIKDAAIKLAEPSEAPSPFTGAMAGTDCAITGAAAMRAAEANSNTFFMRNSFATNHFISRYTYIRNSASHIRSKCAIRRVFVTLAFR